MQFADPLIIRFPKEIFWLLMKPINLYFIIITALSFIPGSPRSPAWNLSTLVIFLILSLVIKMSEDSYKIKQDQHLNEE